ncbi:MAG: SOS response-associated peptidase [Armatimonadetes bacterium]|nr:SOS response-associated peptidase [Armatimonadota bacterium]MCA1995943.1 SOS response-associated peptidase [Armatimonadota bacterium]
MCARSCLVAPAEVVASLFGLSEPPELAPRYNIAPSTPVAAVTEPQPGERRLGLYRWGLVPPWARDPTSGPINARAETAAEKPTFRTALRRRRCLVPATGFFEWREEGGRKQPYLFHRADGLPFGIAGVWETYEGADGAFDSLALLTTASNDLVAPYHDRMPVLIPYDQFDRWLDPELQKPERLTDLLAPGPWPDMVVHPVDRRVGNPRFDVPEAIRPLAP